ncbi:hypothetical protein [Leptolyngbya sp. FACHB-261]|uniref:hypothetical protein n=1 Tax=Leptolyngbya sp. FACHB-261 TaxID=2692806 RepID=UPI001687F179|nr:hypothetical protein [Leptolyngbya sp. FACHB-261]MBD2105220.1 hypothetical protein [Leptolyngbya sp. FACHB-261]
MSGSYYGLIASLPYLPRDLSLRRLPISRQALKLRLKALSLTDQEQINAIIEFHQQLW